MCSAPRRTREEVLRDARALYGFLSDSSDLGSEIQEADIILALGSHDVRVAEHAARLFLSGRAPLVVCTGGLGKVTDGLWEVPEGDVFARRCVELGVPETCVAVERRARNTGENFTLSKALLAERGVFPRTGLIVCKPYMARRAWSTGTQQWSQVRWSVDAPPLTLSEYLGPDTPLKQELELMVGDFQRLKVYADRGFQAPVPIPEAMWETYRRLAADGFDKYVIK